MFLHPLSFNAILLPELQTSECDRILAKADLVGKHRLASHQIVKITNTKTAYASHPLPVTHGLLELPQFVPCQAESCTLTRVRSRNSVRWIVVEHRKEMFVGTLTSLSHSRRSIAVWL